MHLYWELLSWKKLFTIGYMTPVWRRDKINSHINALGESLPWQMFTYILVVYFVLFKCLSLNLIK